MSGRFFRDERNKMRYTDIWRGMEIFMNKKSAVNRRSLCILAIVLLASGLLIYWKYVFGNQLFVFDDIGSDTMQQYVMHYQTIINHVRDGNFSFWISITVLERICFS